MKNNQEGSFDTRKPLNSLIIHAYVDHKCEYGYMLVCDSCKEFAPSHVDTTKQIPRNEAPNAIARQKCEMCKRMGTIH